jgi:hypothetical protein
VEKGLGRLEVELKAVMAKTSSLRNWGEVCWNIERLELSRIAVVETMNTGLELLWIRSLVLDTLLDRCNIELLTQEILLLKLQMENGVSRFVFYLVESSNGHSMIQNSE